MQWIIAHFSPASTRARERLRRDGERAVSRAQAGESASARIDHLQNRNMAGICPPGSALAQPNRRNIRPQEDEY